MRHAHPAIRAIGSLWLAAVILGALLIGLASATAFESLYGTDGALEVFYHSWWMLGLWTALVVNAVVALVLRWPYTRRSLGFIITHASLIVVFSGAMITTRFGERGQIQVGEGASVSEFHVEGAEAIEITGGPGGKSATASVAPDAKDGRFGAVQLGGVTAEVVRRMPDSEWKDLVVDGDANDPPAVEIAIISANERATGAAISGQATSVEGVSVSFRQELDVARWQAVVDGPTSKPGATPVTIEIVGNGGTWTLPVGEGSGAPVPLGSTGSSARILRYLPHAVVGTAGDVVGQSARAVNPFAEVEISGPAGKDLRRVFAKFPDFEEGHGGTAGSSWKLRLNAPIVDAPSTDVEVVAASDGRLCVRLDLGDGEIGTHLVRIGEATTLPAAGRTLEVTGIRPHARLDRTLEAVHPARKERHPGVVVRLLRGSESREVSLQKYDDTKVVLDRNAYTVVFTDRVAPLGFTVKLEKFNVVKYPGSERPRSFESHLRLTDPAGATAVAMVSMNNPAVFGRYHLYQSGFNRDARGAVSVLSVARDPGEWFVFAGYLLLMGGMIFVFVIRTVDRHRGTPPSGRSEPATHPEPLVAGRQREPASTGIGNTVREA